MNIIAKAGYNICWYLLLPFILLGMVVEFIMKVLDVVEGWLFAFVENGMLWVEHNLAQMDENKE